MSVLHFEIDINRKGYDLIQLRSRASRTPQRNEDFKQKNEDNMLEKEMIEMDVSGPTSVQSDITGRDFSKCLRL